MSEKQWRRKSRETEDSLGIKELICLSLEEHQLRGKKLSHHKSPGREPKHHRRLGALKGGDRSEEETGKTAAASSTAAQTGVSGLRWGMELRAATLLLRGKSSLSRGSLRGSSDHYVVSLGGVEVAPATGGSPSLTPNLTRRRAPASR
ncbi:hypothetical protein SRHO_G00189370 [Serrasalmus rhombeus]